MGITAPNTDREPVNRENEVSLLAMASVVLRWRWTIIVLALLGGVAGLASGLLSTRMYASSATFVPQASEPPTSATEAARQLGIEIAPASSGSAWGPAMYVKLMRSRVLLEPIVTDTLTVAEEGGQRIPLLDLLKMEGPTHDRRVEMAVRSLRGMIRATEDRRLGTVDISVASRWPSVSLAIAERLVQRVNQFNLETRKSQAAAERRFAELQALEAERALRDAEDRLQSFLQQNRAVLAPELTFQRDRLTREVNQRQQLYTSWLQSREQARIREIRDTPVITVIDAPRLPFVGEARRSMRKGVLGGLAGGVFGVLLAFITEGLAKSRRAPSRDAREFFHVVSEATPRFLRWRERQRSTSAS